MGRPRTVNCKGCDRHIDDCGPLSARKLCEACSVGRQTAAIEQIAYGNGPAFTSWVSGMTTYVQRLHSASANTAPPTGQPNQLGQPTERK